VLAYLTKGGSHINARSWNSPGSRQFVLIEASVAGGFYPKFYGMTCWSQWSCVLSLLCCHLHLPAAILVRSVREVISWLKSEKSRDVIGLT